MRPFPSDFYGSVTINEKGQIVIPADARKALNLSSGDKLLVLGMSDKYGVVIAKAEDLLSAARMFEKNNRRLKKMVEKESK